MVVAHVVGGREVVGKQKHRAERKKGAGREVRLEGLCTPRNICTAGKYRLYRRQEGKRCREKKPPRKGSEPHGKIEKKICNATLQRNICGEETRQRGTQGRQA